MRASEPPTRAMAVVACDRCGQRFPHTRVSESGHTFCQPCRDALRQDERGWTSRDGALTAPPR